VVLCFGYLYSGAKWCRGVVLACIACCSAWVDGECELVEQIEGCRLGWIGPSLAFLVARSSPGLFLRTLLFSPYLVWSCLRFVPFTP
jgi:hypothetical protein